MKKNYQKPEVVTVLFTDVITTSGRPRRGSGDGESAGEIIPGSDNDLD